MDLLKKLSKMSGFNEARTEGSDIAAVLEDLEKTIPLTEIEKTIPLSDSVVYRLARFSKALNKRYTIRRTLGHGAFGMVFLAEDKKIGRLVAIKQLFESLSSDPKIYERFLQEARIAGQLEHPNIVTVYNVEGDQDNACIVMEYLGGGSLADLLRRDEPIDVRSGINLMLSVLSGLEAAHDIMVVHRDVKPQNILFGVGNTLKITDFGIAHLPVQAGGIESLSMEAERETMIGTPIYMSPEQFKMEAVDKRTDLYSAGAIFYEMLTGAKLFDVDIDTSFEMLKHMVLTLEPKPIKEFRKDVPQEIEDIILRLVAKKADDRFPNTSSAKKALVKALSRIPRPDPEMESELLLTPTCQALYSPAAILEDIIHLLLVDKVISPAERVELQIRTERLGLSDIQARSIEERIRKKQHLPSLSDIESYTELLKEQHAINQKTEFDEKLTAMLRSKQLEFGISEEEVYLLKSHIFKSVAQKNADY